MRLANVAMPKRNIYGTPHVSTLANDGSELVAT
jgi:hypothetical protein